MEKTHQRGAPVSRREALGYLAATGAGLVSASRADVALAQGAAPSRLAGWPAPRVNGFMQIGGANVYYEEQGQGVPVVLCPGGRLAAETTRPVAATLAAKYRVISWDRSNTGRSDVAFKGSKDVDMWADQMVELLGRLNAVPAYLVGPSMGVRTNFAIAVRYPDVVRGLFMYLASGNNLWPGLPQRYWADFADVADKGGMKAVAATPYWAELVQRNPRNQARLLETDPREFSRVMRRWTSAYKKSDVALNMTEGDLRRHSANGVPTRIVAGCAGDDGHPRVASEQMAALLPNAEFLDPPGFCQEWAKRTAESIAWGKEHSQPALQPYYEISFLPALIEDFITKTEAKAKATA